MKECSYTALEAEPKSTQRKRPEGLERILVAAESLFAKQGYEAVTIKAIAKNSGQSQANVIYHFKSKKELYINVLRQARERLVSNATPPDIDSKEFSLGEYISAFAKDHLDMLTKDEKAVRLLYREILGYGIIEGKELAAKVLGHDLGCFVQAMEGSRGSMRKGVSPAAAAFLILGINAMFVHAGNVVRHMPGGQFASGHDKFQKEVINILLNGMLETIDD
ncbi:MAG: TetR/AcrR family transcriptional regulator [Nitrospinota bacterium]|nr:TetR/AcrR family transcriptional regulator [Nitrospinota bacterium]